MHVVPDPARFGRAVNATTAPDAPRHLRKDSDLSAAEVEKLLSLARTVKAAGRTGLAPHLAGRLIALLFEKPSTRTRAAFETAAYALGAQCTYIDPASSHLGDSESVEDTGRVLGRYYDAIAFRGFAQGSVETLANHAGVPVWNALTDTWHPTQALADLLTIEEHHDPAGPPARVCFAGDGRDNVVHSLLVSGAMRGMDLRIACPGSLSPEPGIVAIAQERAAQSGGRILITEDVGDAIRDADFVYADVWLSMGEDRGAWEDRIRLLRPYRVDRPLLERSGNPGVRFLHCLPSTHDRRSALGDQLFRLTGLEGMEVSDEVFRSSASLVFDQAENRRHTIAAVMLHSLAEGAPGIEER